MKFHLLRILTAMYTWESGWDFDFFGSVIKFFFICLPFFVLLCTDFIFSFVKLVAELVEHVIPIRLLLEEEKETTIV